jgi:UDP-N-acetylmuramate--alanine ligase
VKATIEAIKGNWSTRRLVVLFQPHRYSRTAHLYKEFGAVFKGADVVKILDIYAASEKPVPGVSSQLIIDAIAANGQQAMPFKGLELLLAQLRPGDIVLTLGAGDVYKTGEELLTKI